MSLGSTAFGVESNTFKGTNEELRNKFKTLCNLDFRGILNLVFLLTNKKLSRLLGLRMIPKDISDFFVTFLTTVINHREENKLTRKDFVQLMVDQKNNESAENKFTMNEIVGNSFGFFVAGHETSSATTTFCLFELAHHPDIQEKVRNEVLKVLAKSNGRITYEALAEMRYAEQVLNGNSI